MLVLRTSVKCIRGAYCERSPNSTNQQLSSTARNDIECSYMCRVAPSANQMRKMHKLNSFHLVKCCSLLRRAIHGSSSDRFSCRPVRYIALGADSRELSRTGVAPRVEAGAALDRDALASLAWLSGRRSRAVPRPAGTVPPFLRTRTAPSWPESGAFTVRAAFAFSWKWCCSVVRLLLECHLPKLGRRLWTGWELDRHHV